MGKILESENGVSVLGIFGIVAIVVINAWTKTAKTAIENDYDVSVKMQEHGEACFKSSEKKKKEKENEQEEDEEQEADEQEIKEGTT